MIRSLFTRAQVVGGGAPASSMPVGPEDDVLTQSIRGVSSVRLAGFHLIHEG
jgi:hypothetical protein